MKKIGVVFILFILMIIYSLNLGYAFCDYDNDPVVVYCVKDEFSSGPINLGQPHPCSQSGNTEVSKWAGEYPDCIAIENAWSGQEGTGCSKTQCDWIDLEGKGVYRPGESACDYCGEALEKVQPRDCNEEVRFGGLTCPCANIPKEMACENDGECMEKIKIGKWKCIENKCEEIKTIGVSFLNWDERSINNWDLTLLKVQNLDYGTYYFKGPYYDSTTTGFDLSSTVASGQKDKTVLAYGEVSVPPDNTREEIPLDKLGCKLGIYDIETDKSYTFPNKTMTKNKNGLKTANNDLFFSCDKINWDNEPFGIYSPPDSSNPELAKLPIPRRVMMNMLLSDLNECNEKTATTDNFNALICPSKYDLNWRFDYALDEEKNILGQTLLTPSKEVAVFGKPEDVTGSVEFRTFKEDLGKNEYRQAQMRYIEKGDKYVIDRAMCGVPPSFEVTFRQGEYYYDDFLFLILIPVNVNINQIVFNSRMFSLLENPASSTFFYWMSMSGLRISDFWVSNAEIDSKYIKHGLGDQTVFIEDEMKFHFRLITGAGDNPSKLEMTYSGKTSSSEAGSEAITKNPGPIIVAEGKMAPLFYSSLYKMMIKNLATINENPRFKEGIKEEGFDLHFKPTKNIVADKSGYVTLKRIAENIDECCNSDSVSLPKGSLETGCPDFYTPEQASKLIKENPGKFAQDAAKKLHFEKMEGSLDSAQDFSVFLTEIYDFKTKTQESLDSVSEYTSDLSSSLKSSLGSPEGEDKGTIQQIIDAINSIEESSLKGLDNAKSGVQYMLDKADEFFNTNRKDDIKVKISMNLNNINFAPFPEPELKDFIVQKSADKFFYIPEGQGEKIDFSKVYSPTVMEHVLREYTTWVKNYNQFFCGAPQSAEIVAETSGWYYFVPNVDKLNDIVIRREGTPVTDFYTEIPLYLEFRKEFTNNFPAPLIQEAYGVGGSYSPNYPIVQNDDVQRLVREAYLREHPADKSDYEFIIGDLFGGLPDFIKEKFDFMKEKIYLKNPVKLRQNYKMKDIMRVKFQISDNTISGGIKVTISDYFEIRDGKSGDIVTSSTNTYSPDEDFINSIIDAKKQLEAEKNGASSENLPFAKDKNGKDIKIMAGPKTATLVKGVGGSLMYKEMIKQGVRTVLNMENSEDLFSDKTVNVPDGKGNMRQVDIKIIDSSKQVEELKKYMDYLECCNIFKTKTDKDKTSTGTGSNKYSIYLLRDLNEQQDNFMEGIGYVVESDTAPEENAYIYKRFNTAQAGGQALNIYRLEDEAVYSACDVETLETNEKTIDNSINDTIFSSDNAFSLEIRQGSFITWAKMNITKIRISSCFKDASRFVDKIEDEKSPSLAEVLISARGVVSSLEHPYDLRWIITWWESKF
jgi:hypothetical protein